MNFLDLIPLIVAVGAIKSILIFAFLFFGIGFRGFLGAVLSLIMGITVVWPNIQNFSSVSQIESSYQISINKEKLTEYFSKDSITTIAGNQFTDGLKAFVILIPFIIIDLVALILFRVLDLGSYPIDFLTIPLKIILFLSVDGVNLIFKILGIGA